MCSKGKSESSDYIDAPGENYFDLIRHDQGYSDGSNESSEGKSTDEFIEGFDRCWEIEQDGQQILDVRTRKVVD